MSVTTYDIGVRLSMSTAGFGAGAGIAMKLLGDLDGKSTQAEAAISKLAGSMGLTNNAFVRNANTMGMYQTQIGAMTTAHNNLATAMGGVTKMAIGAGLLGVSAVGVSAITGWVSAAGTMQDALTQVGIAAQGTKGQLQDLFTQSFNVANATQYSAGQVLAMDQIMGRMNFNDPTNKLSQRQVIHAAIPQFARAAEIAQHFQGTGYEETITGLAQQAHMLGSYSGTALARNVGYSTELGIVSHMTAQEQARALSYLTPSLKTGQLDPLDAMALVAVSNQTGLNQGKGGSNLGALLRGLAPTGAHKHDTALQRIEQLGGGNFYDATGNAVPLTTALGILNRFYDSKNVTNEARGVIALHGLGVQGARAASVLGSDLSIGQFKGLRARIAGGTPAASVEEQRQLDATLPGQLHTLTGNMGSLAAIMGTGLLPVIAPIAHGFVLMTGALVDFLSHHQEVAQFVGTFVLAGTIVTGLGGAFLLASGAVAVLTASGVLAEGALAPFLITALGVSVAIAAGVLIWQHWGTIMDALSGQFGGVWQVLTVGVAAIGATIAVGQVASAVFGALSAATFVLSGGFGVAALAGGALDLLLGGVSAVAAAAAFGYGLLDAAVMALSGGFGIAAIAAGALDLLLSPYTVPIMAIIAAVGGAIYVFQNWSKVSTILGNVFGWLGDKLRGFLTFLGILHDGGLHVGSSGVTAPQASAYNAAHPYAPPINAHTHGHWRAYRGGATWVPDPSPAPSHGAAGSSVTTHHHGPITVGPIHVHGAAQHDPHALAKLVAAEVQAAISLGLHNSLNREATSVTSLTPSTHTLRMS